MSSPFKRIAAQVLLSTLILSACQTATPAPAPTPVPPTSAPTATAAPTAVPLHPAVKADAARVDFSNTTMTHSPGEIEPGGDLQVVFNAAAGQKVNIKLTIESGLGLPFPSGELVAVCLFPKLQVLQPGKGKCRHSRITT